MNIQNFISVHPLPQRQSYFANATQSWAAFSLTRLAFHTSAVDIQIIRHRVHMQHGSRMMPNPLSIETKTKFQDC